MTATIMVSHNFETAHRLPHLPGKCQSLHGHSWWVDVTVAADNPDDNGVLVEFGAYKRELRAWIDQYLDHGTILGAADPLVQPLRDAECKVYTLDGWPTVETVARHLAYMATELLAVTGHAPGAYVSSVEVRETHLNRAAWRAP